MHIVIVGAGRIGVSLARWLVSAGHEIAAVDCDRSRCSVIDESLGSVSVTGDGTNVGLLGKAGANRAQVLIATTSRDDVNLVACQLAKHHFDVPRTISVVNIHDHAQLFSILGIDIPIDVTEIVLDRVQERIALQGLVRLMPVLGRDSQSLVAIKVPPQSGIEGRLIKDLSLPDGTLITLVISRDGNASIPDENTLIRAGDEVVAVTTAQAEEELRHTLLEESEA
jgi:trk system potassium uptake protein TrkA